MRPFGLIVLAAGGSSRIGKPKQLLPYLGHSLVEHAARVAIASGAREVVVVVGAHADEVRKRLKHLRVRVVLNRDWAEGMGGSVRAGVAALSEKAEAVVISLCDQPRITPTHLRALAERALSAQTGPIAASSYDGVIGAPSAFAKSIYPQLLALKGEAGARELVRGSEKPVAIVPFEDANIDVDTPEDYLRLVPEGDIGEPREACSETADARAPPAPENRSHKVAAK